jgi:hypothetical protein
MNLFVAIVPMLLLSAVFVSISAIELSMPKAGSVPQQRDDFVLALRITSADWWVEARGQGPERLARGDTAALLQRLEALHAEHPEHTSVIVACAEAVEYDEVDRGRRRELGDERPVGDGRSRPQLREDMDADDDELRSRATCRADVAGHGGDTG